MVDARRPIFDVAVDAEVVEAIEQGRASRAPPIPAELGAIWGHSSVFERIERFSAQNR